MALTYVVNDDKSVTILQDGAEFLHQATDPVAGGNAKFKTTADASAWAEAAVTAFQAELDEAKAKAEESSQEAAVYLEEAQATLGLAAAPSEE